MLCMLLFNFHLITVHNAFHAGIGLYILILLGTMMHLLLHSPNKSDICLDDTCKFSTYFDHDVIAAAPQVQLM